MHKLGIPTSARKRHARGRTMWQFAHTSHINDTFVDQWNRPSENWREEDTVEITSLQMTQYILNL